MQPKPPKPSSHPNDGVLCCRPPPKLPLHPAFSKCKLREHNTKTKPFHLAQAPPATALKECPAAAPPCEKCARLEHPQEILNPNFESLPSQPPSGRFTVKPHKWDSVGAPGAVDSLVCSLSVSLSLFRSLTLSLSLCLCLSLSLCSGVPHCARLCQAAACGEATSKAPAGGSESSGLRASAQTEPLTLQGLGLRVDGFRGRMVSPLSSGLDYRSFFVFRLSYH